MATELKQTKNSFKFVGKVSRIDKDGAFKDEVATKGKREGDNFRALRFGVKTSVNNEMTVSMYDFEPTEAFLWNSEKAKKAKEANKTYKGEKIPFSEWLENEADLRAEGYTSLQTRVGLTYDDKNKLVSNGFPSFVASKNIYNGLSNGDSIVVEGEIRYSTYKNQQDKVVEQKTYTIKKVFKLKDVDFDHEDFEEVTYFEQEFVFVGAEADKDNKKVYITGRVIDYQKNFHDTQFVVDYSDGLGGTDKDMVKLAEASLKKFKFGDLLTVHGDALNRVVVEEVEETEEDEKDALLASLGGKNKPKHAQGYSARTYITEMQVLGVDDWLKKAYKEEDFVKETLLSDDKEDLSSELGGKKKKKNPFEKELDSDDIGEDELPF